MSIDLMLNLSKKNEIVAAGLGFEPRLPGPEPDVLPLDDPATKQLKV